MIFTGFVLWDFCKTFDKSQIFCKESFWKSRRASTSCKNNSPKTAQMTRNRP